MPPPAVNRIGTPHKLATKVTKYSDGSPLMGYEVTYRVTAGPAATFAESKSAQAVVLTDKNGIATATLVQDKAVPGVNKIGIDIVRPENKACCRPAVPLYSGQTTKTWVAPQIAIRKTAPATAIVGQTFQYGIAVSNPSKTDARNVVVTDVLPEGIAYVASTPAAKVDGQSLTWALGALGAGQQQSVAVTVKGTKTGTFTNCAEVKADDGLSGKSCADNRITRAAIALEKTGPAEVILCDPITYVVTVRNTGDAPATNVRIVDSMSEALTTVDGRSSVSIEVGTLQAGEAKAYKVNAKAARKGEYTNKAEATADGGLKASAEAKTTVRQPALVLTKEAPKDRFIGLAVTQTLTVTNKGDAPARNTVLTDTLPPQLQFVSASDGGTFAGGVATWQLGTLEPGAAKKVTLVAKAVAAGEARNVASAKAYCAEGRAEAVTSLKGIPAILLECVDLEDPIEVGTGATYVITVTNQGSAVGTNIKIVCTLPAEEEFVSAGGPAKHDVKGKDVAFEPLPTLAPKAKAVYRVVVKGVKAGDARFKVSLTSDQMASPAEETESTHIYK